MPTVSVIMPCFNHARFLNDSVRSVLGQSGFDLELIVVDDCSTDGSWETLSNLAKKDSRLRIHGHSINQGASRSRNDAIKMATGDFIAFCDADDVWEKDKLELQIKMLRSNPDYDFAYCDAKIVDENGEATGRLFSQLFPPPSKPSGNLFDVLIVRNFINMQSVLMRRKCLELTGHFDEKIKWVEDWWFWIKASSHYRFLYTSALLARYRIHRASTSKLQKHGYFVNRFTVCKRVLTECRNLTIPGRAKIVYGMGVGLCELGKYRSGRRLLWHSAGLAIADVRALAVAGNALRRLVLYRTRKGASQFFDLTVDDKLIGES
jgi:glycosyltransferase involved in cell wall biosynthesis